MYDVTDRTWSYNTDAFVEYQLRERVDTVYPGAAGEPVYRIVRSRRDDAQSPWRDDSVMAVVITTQLVRRTLANRTTVELVFPVGGQRAWNPNVFTGRDSTVRTYAAFDQPLSLPTGKQFARTVRVVDEGEDNLFYLREQSSSYARGVGRVSRIRRTLDFCQFNDSVTTGCSVGPGYIVRGFEREEYLREFGAGR